MKVLSSIMAKGSDIVSNPALGHIIENGGNIEGLISVIARILLT